MRIEILDLEAPVPERAKIDDKAIFQAGSPDTASWFDIPEWRRPIRELSLCRSRQNNRGEVSISTPRTFTFDRRVSRRLRQISRAIRRADVLVGHNLEYDLAVLNQALEDNNLPPLLPVISDTMRMGTVWMNLRQCGNQFGSYKFPSLSELYERLGLGVHHANHDSSKDSRATAECLWGLVNRGVVVWDGTRFVRA